MRVFDGLFDIQSLLAAADVMVKALIATLIAAGIGYEREVKGHPAGIRTHMLVALGVVFFTEAGRSFGADPGRVASQVVTGIGFLGAGTILRMGLDVKGLTTAASIWTTAAIAMVVCLGGAYLLLGVAAGLAALATLSVVDRIENRFVERAKKDLCLAHLDSAERIPDLLEAVRSAEGQLVSLDVTPTESGVDVQMIVRGNLERLMKSITNVRGLQASEWRP